MELSEAHLVVNEKVPVPRFNFVQDARCGAGRVAAFVERTLEHYYQRALRPTFELPKDVHQPALEHALELSGYLPKGREHRRHLLLWNGQGPPPAVSNRDEVRVETLSDDELPTLVDLLVESNARYREEVRRYLEVGMGHPNPGERVVPYVARTGSGAVSFGVLLSHATGSGLYAVGTPTSERARGYASRLVAEVLRREAPRSPFPFCISAQGTTPPRPLLEMGFEVGQSFEVFEMSAETARKGF